tara:strand:+ start:559 stop:1200 length:642 start_codon:yes stop_codon:yes gene_type:complete
MAATIRTDKIGPVSGSADFTLPTSDGSAKSALITDGSKVLSFATGTPSASNFLRGDGTWAAAGGGKVLQVISNTWSTASSTTSGTYALVTDSGTTITPAATSSKIWISGYVSIDTAGSDQGRVKLYNGASEITAASGTVGSGTNPMVAANGMNYAVAGVNSLAYSFLLSPSTTSAVTINLYHAVSGGTNYINRNHGNTTEGFSSSMTLMEIGA